MYRHGRPRTAILLVCAVLPAGLLLGGDAPGVDGHWEGEIRLPGAPLGIVVDLTRDTDGSLSGKIDIPLQGARDLPLSEISVEGRAVAFAISGIPGGPSFSGMLSDDGSRISGIFSQSGQQLPFELQRGAAPATEQPETATRTDPLEGVDRFVEEVREAWRTPGIAVAVIRDDELVHAAGYGLRDVESGEAVTPQTLFAIGSATKAFTATLVAMLVDEGGLAWDAPVRDYLPRFALRDELAAARLTVRDLLTHRSGLPRHDLAWYGSTATREELLGRLAHLEASRGFRDRFQYQNLMYMAAGYLAGRVGGSSWETLLRERILRPLGMDSSGVSVEDLERSPRRALPYAEEDPDGDGTKQLQRIAYRQADAVGPAGSIHSSVTEMAQWLRLHLGRGEIDGRRLVSESAMREMHTPQVVVPPAATISKIMVQPELPHLMYGLGWFIQSYRGHELLHHGGNIDGFSALVGFMPRERLGVVVLTNGPSPFPPLVVLLGLFDRLLGLEAIDWQARLRLVEGQLQLAQEQQERQQATGRREGTAPSHPLADYAGAYAHPGYGAVAIGESDGRLYLRFNALEGPLDHWHYDVFRLADGLAAGTKVGFSTNARGDIDSLQVQLEPALPEIRFARRPPASLSEPRFLDRLVGDYALGGAVCRVRLRADGRLTLTVPGQPTYELDPYRGTEFDLHGQAGYSVRFTLEEREGAKATELVFRQPNGVFTARRED